MVAPSDGSQLPLPNVTLASAPGSSLQVTQLPRDRRVYVNRTLRMDQIEWVGFDMDYTLAIYKQDEMDRLSIDATVRKMVDRGYPPILLEARIDPSFAIRGLVIDKRFGHVLKMDRYKFVGRAWHGLQELPREERYALYHAKKIRVAPPRYHWIDTLYALPEASLYAGAVDLLDRYGINVDYEQLFQDIRECIDEAHRDGSINDTIAQDLPRFVDRDPSLAATLHKLRSAGKKLFVLTNSRWAYTDKMMTYLLQGALPEYTHWRQYFDLVSVAASKPSFFTERRPFLERVFEGDTSTTRTAYTLERNHIYEGGNLRDFERMVNVTGDRILYVGDHIFGDILRSKKDSSWRTAMIIQEMAAEMTALDQSEEDLERLDAMARRRERLEDELRFYQSRYRGAARKTTTPELVEESRLAIDNLKLALRDLDVAYRTLKKTTDGRFHHYWGSLFKQGVELSSFGDQVEEYACLYTSRVSNLLQYSPLHYFRSSRDLMPHEF